MSERKLIVFVNFVFHIFGNVVGEQVRAVAVQHERRTVLNEHHRRVIAAARRALFVFEQFVYGGVVLLLRHSVGTRKPESFAVIGSNEIRHCRCDTRGVAVSHEIAAFGLCFFQQFGCGHVLTFVNLRSDISVFVFAAADKREAACHSEHDCK